MSREDILAMHRRDLDDPPIRLLKVTDRAYPGCSTQSQRKPSRTLLSYRNSYSDTCDTGRCPWRNGLGGPLKGRTLRARPGVFKKTRLASGARDKR
jgi:hypothetical protein